MKICLSVVAAVVCAGAVAAPAEAGEKSHYSKTLQTACAEDYRRHCGEYGIETEALRLCMDRNGKSLTKTCVNALVAEGEISRAEVERRKKQAP
jgi:hypothetical protein